MRFFSGRSLPIALLLASLSASLAGMPCLAADAKPGARPTGKPEEKPVAKPTAKVKPITQAEAEAWGKAMKALFVEKKGDAMALVDFAAMRDRALTGVDADERVKRDLMAGINEAVPVVVDTWRALVADGGMFDVLRFREVDGAPHLLVRLIPAGGGVNYMEWRLSRGDDGRVVADDCNQYLDGQYMSRTMRPSYLMAVVASTKGKISQEMRDLAAHVPDQMQIIQCLGAGRIAEAEAKWNGLPDSIKKMRMFMVLHVRIQQTKGDQAATEKAIDDFAAAYPDASNIELWRIDVNFAKGHFREALQAMESLDKRVGGDPYLSVLRANTLVQVGDLDGAGALLVAAMKQEPTLKAAADAMLDLAFSKKDWKGAVEAFSRLESDFKMKFGDLRENPFFADFCASLEGQKWLADHGFAK